MVEPSNSSLEQVRAMQVVICHCALQMRMLVLLGALTLKQDVLLAAHRELYSSKQDQPPAVLVVPLAWPSEQVVVAREDQLPL
jgi:hypothetical protein